MWFGLLFIVQCDYFTFQVKDHFFAMLNNAPRNPLEVTGDTTDISDRPRVETEGNNSGDTQSRGEHSHEGPEDSTRIGRVSEPVLCHS